MSSLQNIDLKRAYQLLKIPFLSPIDEVVLAHQALIKYFNSNQFQQTEPPDVVDLAIQQINKAFKRITSTFKVEYLQFQFESQQPQPEPIENPPIEVKLNFKNLENIDNHEKRLELPFNVLRRDGSVRSLSKRVSISNLESSSSDAISVRSVENCIKEKSSSTQINQSIVIENSNVKMGNVHIVNSNEGKTIKILKEIRKKLEDTLPNVPNKNGQMEILFDFTNVYRELGMLPDNCTNQCISFRLENIFDGGVEHLKVSKKVNDSSGNEKNEERILRFEIEQGTANCTRVFIPVECDSFFGESGQMKALDENFLIGNVMPNEEHSDRRVWPTLNPHDRSHLLKLSVNCLLAQNCHDVTQSVRSQCGVCSDVYYYEVYLFSGGSMRIGWATKQTDLNGSTIGGDRYSIALDGSSDRHRIYHQRTDLSVNQSSSIFNFSPKLKTRWFEDDVIGCLIDFNRKIFNFYVNGKLVEYNNREVHFEDGQSYYAVSLTDNQMCYFNFGQTPFKYAQVDEFKTICQNFEDYQLLELYFPSGYLNEILTNSHVDGFFDDPKQKNMDILANQIEQNILDSPNIALNQGKLSEKMRIIQAIIEVDGRRFQDNQFNIRASWIANLITESTRDNPAFPYHVCQLLYPYFTLRLTNDTATKHRNVCIILASLVSVISDFKVRVNLYELVLAYLTEIISKWDQLSDEILFVAVLVAMGNMELNEEERINLKSNEKLRNALKSMSNADLNDIAILARLSTVRQLALLSQLTLEHLFNSNQTNLHSQPFSNATLDPSNCSDHTSGPCGC